jgi:uncharacterized protein with von Willebrand factor type A (vWA) domain
LSLRFDPSALETRFEPLDRMSRRLWLPAIVNTEGTPVERLEALAAARLRLLAGGAVFERGARWPDEDAAEIFGAVCARLGLGEVARASEEVTDQVLRSVLWHLDRVALLRRRMDRPAALQLCAQAFFDDWEPSVEELRAVLRVFESLDGIANFARWSEMRGLLHSEAWQQVLAARERIERIPRLSQLIRRLGRARPSEREVDTESARPQPCAQTPAWVRRQREVELPGAPLETEGIRRSGDFTRMLASEAMQLRRRRRLLAARIAEQTLLSYQHRQFSMEWTWVRAPGVARAPDPVKRPEMVAGPMILCVDTSASMNGAPEQIAKAIVLEAMRAASAQRRDCLLYAFSGPGDLCTLELGAHLDGVRAVAGFLSRSFHGGTDICEPFERALQAIEEQRWRSADLLIASDGEFGAPASLMAALAGARSRHGLRVQGVLIGDRMTIGLRQVCDDVFWVRDWRRYGHHGQVEPPIHSSELTRQYFPGAFVGRAEGAKP